MGGIVSGIFGGGESKSKQRSDPKDLTPGQFTELRQPIADEIMNIFSRGGGQAFPGPFAAGVSGNEQQILGQLMQSAGQPSNATQAGQNFLQQMIQGGGFNVPDRVGQTGQLPGLVDIQGIQGGTPQGQENPFLQQAIDAAQRPLIENFQDVVAPALRAQFTQAGQQIQGQGSSPFHMAAARAQSGLADALGDIGSEMAFQDFAQRQQLGSAEFQQLRDLMTGQNLEGRSQELQRMLTGRAQDVTQRGQDIQAETTGRQQQLDAVATAANIDRAQLDNMLANLEAQALPRLVEQLGIDRGLEEFRRREERLMQALQVAGQLASPTVASVSRGESSSRESSGGLGEAIGAGLSFLF